MSEAPKADLECTKAMAEAWRDDYNGFRSKYTGKLKMLLLVRRDLGMGAGKIAAQCGHAAMGAVTQWLVPNHELVMKSPDRVENPWDEDLQIYYAPEFGDSGDSDDEDDEYSAEVISASSKGETLVTELQVQADAPAAAAVPSAPSSAPGDINQINQQPTKPGATEEVPLSAPGDHSRLNNLLETPTNASASQPRTESSPVTEEPPQETERYQTSTPREIRKELYGTEAPIQAMMKLAVAEWVWKGQAKIALKVNSDPELSSFVKILRNHGIPFVEIHDAGLTQIAYNTRTVVGVGPFPADILDPLFKSLKLL